MPSSIDILRPGGFLCAAFGHAGEMFPKDKSHVFFPLAQDGLVAFVFDISEVLEASRHKAKSLHEVVPVPSSLGRWPQHPKSRMA